MKVYAIYIYIIIQQVYIYDVLKLFRIIFLSYRCFLCRCFAIHFHPVYRYIFGIKNFFFPAPEIEKKSEQVYRKKCFLSLSEKFN